MADRHSDSETHVPPDGSPDAAAIGRALVASVGAAVVVTDLDGRITGWNDEATRLFGHDADEAVGRSVDIIVPPEGETADRELRTRIRRGERIADLETRRRRRDGTLVPVVVTMVPVADDSGAVTGIVRILGDLLERRFGPHASHRLAAIVESSDDAIVSKDLTGVVTSWNHAAERMFGYAAAEIVGRSIRLIIPDDRQDEEDEVLARVCRGERVEHFETLRQRKDGTIVPVSLTISPIRDAHGTVIGASKIARDVSERRRTEVETARLLAVTREHSMLAETLNRVGVAVASTLDPDAIVQAVTDAATEATRASYGAFFHNVVDGQGHAYMRYTVAGAAASAFERVPVPPSASAFEPMFRERDVVRYDDITNGEAEGEWALHFGMPPGGVAVRSFMAVPVKARSGTLLGGLFFGHAEIAHFTARHEQLATGIGAWASLALENARLYIGAQQANRLKDEFLATLSHELRTPLNAIVGYARMLRAGVLGEEQWERAVESIDRNAASLTQIVEDVLDVSRFMSGKTRLAVQRVNLSDTVQHAVDAVMSAAEARQIHVDLVIDPRAPPVSGDPGRLQQVAWNLLSNAVKFTPRDGRVQIRVERVDACVEMIVSDTGIGIAPEFLPHVFETFRQENATPNRERGGLGLGLAIARELVEMHGGTIRAASGGVGQGATLVVRLPIGAPPPYEAEEPADPRGGRVN